MEPHHPEGGTVSHAVSRKIGGATPTRPWRYTPTQKRILGLPMTRAERAWSWLCVAVGWRVQGAWWRVRYGVGADGGES